MTLSSITPKKFSYTLREQWDISGFQSNKFLPYASPFSLALLIIQFPSQLFQDQFTRMTINAFLVYIVFLRVILFLILILILRRSGRSYEVEFAAKEIKVKKMDGSVLTIPLASLKQYRITPRIMTLSTLKSGISLPTRVLSKKEKMTILTYCTDRLEKNYNPSIWKKLVLVLFVIFSVIVISLLPIFMSFIVFIFNK